MDTTTLLASHLLVLTLGASSGWVAARWQGRKIIRRIEETAMADTTAPPDRELPPARRYKQRGPTPGALVLIILVGSVMLIGFGIQQGDYQRQQAAEQAADRDQAACFQEWGDDLIKATEARVTASKRIERAEDRRDDSIDSIVLFIIATRAEDPPPSEAESERGFAEVLAGFAAAKANLDRAKVNLKGARRANPYPDLDC